MRPWLRLNADIGFLGSFNKDHAGTSKWLAVAILKNDPTAAFIKSQTEGLAREIANLDVKPIQEMAGGNALVVAKIVLSLCRRIENAAEFFAQGRITYA